MKNTVFFVMLCLLGILSPAVNAKTYELPYPDINSDKTIDWDSIDLYEEFTHRFAVIPIDTFVDYTFELVEFEGQSYRAGREKNTFYVYDKETGKETVYDLYDPDIRYKEKIEGWVDLNGRYILEFDDITSGGRRYGYIDGIGLNIRENLDSFDTIKYVDGIMILEFTDTLSEYNIRRYGEERPSIYYNGEKAPDKDIVKTFFEGDDPRDIRWDARYRSVVWQTPRGELIADYTVLGPDEITDTETYLYDEIIDGTYVYEDHAIPIKAHFDSTGQIVFDTVYSQRHLRSAEFFQRYRTFWARIMQPVFGDMRKAKR